MGNPRAAAFLGGSLFRRNFFLPYSPFAIRHSPSFKPAGQMTTQPTGFIKKHGLWTSEQSAQAAEVRLRIEREKLQFVRMAWADPHGASRAKAVTVPAFLSALTNGYNINVATTTL